MMGQPYKVHLDLEMPESPVNRELGRYLNTKANVFVDKSMKTLKQ